ncbi:MAG: hypothetical protein J4428_01505 [Candidatus Aenigmarchaeota archaeon]|nr:hypothetical protein [Candidatus Aenigmarchaeota archaeon]
MKEQFLKLKKFLDDNNTEYKVMEHEPVYTSEEAAKVRGVELKSGVKALVLKTNEDAYLLALVSADKKIDLKLLAGIIGTKKLSLASPDKVLEITGCEIGSVHPFGNVHNLTTYMDPGISGNEMVDFNAGMHTISIEMKSKDMIKLIKPKIVKLSRNS